MFGLSFVSMIRDNVSMNVYLGLNMRSWLKEKVTFPVAAVCGLQKLSIHYETASNEPSIAAINLKFSTFGSKKAKKGAAFLPDSH